ncbi:unnamed protein product [Ixodes persulcatus]
MHFFYFLVYRYGVCVPSTCQREDVEKIASSLAKTAEFEVKVSRCEVKQDGANLNEDQTTIVTMVVILMVIVLLSTAVDGVKEARKQPEKKDNARESFLARFTTSFSLIRSVKSVFRSNTSLGHLNAVHGLRTLSLLWFMLGHIFLFLNYQFFRNLMIAVGFAKDFSFQMVINSTLATDTLIFLNGFLFGYHGLVDHDITRKRRQPFFNTLHKAYRAAVAMLLATAVAMLLPVIGSGPMWKETMDTVASNCRTNWWLNILFVNNLFVSPQDRFMSLQIFTAIISETHFLGAVLFEFVLCLSCSLSLRITFVTFLSPLSFTTLLLSTRCASLSSSLSAHGRCQLSTVMGKNNVFFQDPPARMRKMSSFCPGFYLVVDRATDVLRTLGWVCSFLCAVAVLFGAYRWNCGEGLGTAQVALYAAVHRTVWALSIAWVTFACATGKAWLVGDFLSWSAFGPLSRLAPLVFLLHPLVQNVFTAYVRERVQADQLMALFLFCGLIVMGYLGAFLCSIITDEPLHALEQIMCEKMGIIATKDGCPRRFLEVAKPVLKALPLPSCTKITILGEKMHADGKPSGDSRL